MGQWLMLPSAAARAFILLPRLIWSGIRPPLSEPIAWYDRLIRIVGGVLVLLVLIGGFIFWAMEILSR